MEAWESLAQKPFREGWVLNRGLPDRSSAKLDGGVQAHDSLTQRQPLQNGNHQPLEGLALRVPDPGFATRPHTGTGTPGVGLSATPPHP